MPKFKETIFGGPVSGMNMGGVKDFLFGKEDKTQQLSTMTPEQIQYQNMILQGSKPGMQSGFDYLNQIMSGDPKAMEAFEAPYLRQYQEQIIPELAERFAGLNAQGSSAFGQSLGQAGAGLQESLAALRQNLMMQAMQQLQGFGQMGMQPQFENIYQPGTGGFMGAVGQGVGQAAGAAGMAML